MAKILLVEDDVPLANVIATWLETQNYVVDQVHNGEDAMQVLTNYQYDLLIFDWELGGVAGISVCKWFRNRGGSTPILFLTGRSDITSKVEGLETGADDYLCKPFEYRELSARIKTLLRRPTSMVSSVLKVGNMALNVVTRKVSMGENEIVLTPREFGLLEYLMRHPDVPYSSRTLLDSVYPLDSALSEDTVRSCMRSLRKKLTFGDEPCPVKTTRKQGYFVESNPGESKLADADASSANESDS